MTEELFEKMGWKIKVRRGAVEVEVAGMFPDKVKAWYDQLEKKYLQ